MRHLIDSLAPRGLIKDTYNTQHVAIRRRLMHEACDTEAIRRLTWETCGTLSPREIVHDDTYDTLASKGLKHGTSNALVINK